jgi:hypothetical protein
LLEKDLVLLTIVGEAMRGPTDSSFSAYHPPPGTSPKTSGILPTFPPGVKSNIYEFRSVVNASCKNANNLAEIRSAWVRRKLAIGSPCPRDFSRKKSRR